MIDLNQFNQTYYQKQGTTEVPDLLSSVPQIQEAIRLAIETQIHTDPIRVLELGFGSRPDRYTQIMSRTKRRWQVTLSDFDPSILPDLPKVRTMKLNLLTDPLPPGPYDVILSTYTFDSIDFPEDSYQNGRHYPGGLIRIAEQSLSSLNPGGFFLTIDAWAAGATPADRPAGGARFKSLDLQAAATMLSSVATASLINLNDFLDQYHQQLPIDLSDHACLICTR